MTIEKCTGGYYEGEEKSMDCNYCICLLYTSEYLSETVSCEVTVKRLKSGKHIFSHVEWHMRGYEIILPEGKPQDVVHGLLLCDLSEVQEKYPIPVAFHIFLHQI